MPAESTPAQHSGHDSQATDAPVAFYSLFRLALAFGLLGFWGWLLWQGIELPVPRAFVTVFIVVAFVFTGASALFIPRFGRTPGFRWAQLLFDMLVFTVLVALTDGPTSSFFPLYFVNTVAAVWLLPTWGALVIAGLDVLLFSAVSLLGGAGLLPFEEPWPLAAVYSELTARVFALLLAGILAVRLAVGLRRELAQRIAEARRLEQEQAVVLTQVPAGVLITDRAGVVSKANSAASVLLGKVEGRSLDDVLSPSGDRWEQTVSGPAGVRQLLCSRRVADSDDQIVILEDLTEIRALQAAQERDERLAAVGRIAASMAHEIRNPLASLSGAVQLLQGERPDPLHAIVLREVDRLRGLVDDFLDAAQPLRLAPEPIDPTALIEEVVEAFRADPRHADRMEVAILGQAGPKVVVDPRRLRQVLWNLLLNAAQATPERGRIELSTAVEERALVVRVRDDGLGISPSDLGRIFDPFYTTRSGGTGLGLANVYRVVTAHGGTVDVESAPGNGTTFTLRLPLVPGAAEETSIGR